MIRALPFVITLCACAASQASIRFFFTSSADSAGLSDTTHVFDDTDGKQTDGTSYVLRDAAPLVGVPTVDPSAGEYLYLWAKFEGEKDDRTILGIHLVGNDQSFSDRRGEADRGIYLGLDENGDSGEGLRWVHNSKTYDESEVRPGMVLLATVTPGIKNQAGNGWLYRGGEERVALLGAILPEAGEYEVRMGLGLLGVGYRTNSDGETHPKTIKLGADEEEFEGGFRGDDAEVLYSTDADAIVVPEPGALMALLLAVGLRRR